VFQNAHAAVRNHNKTPRKNTHRQAFYGHFHFIVLPGLTAAERSQGNRWRGDIQSNAQATLLTTEEIYTLNTQKIQ